MTRPVACALALALTACGGGSVELSGELADGEAADSVWHLGGTARAEIQGDSFRLPTVRGADIDLRFAGGDEGHARMEIRDAPGGVLRLRGIWMEDGLAYPSSVETDAGGVVRVNGVRFGDSARLPRSIDAEAVVLAASRSGDALLVRPADGGLPDLRVVVTPATTSTSPDGDPVDVDAVEPGDTVRVRGTAEAGYVVAAELVVPRRAALRENGSDG